MTNLIRFALPAMLALGAQLPGAAFAQAGPQPAPMNPSAPTAPLAYESAFAGYRTDAPVTAVEWKESNARVARPLEGANEHDGHAGHAGHDMGAAKPAPPPPPASKKDPHHGHQHKE